MAYFDTIFENAEQLLFNGLGEDLTYYPKDGEPRSIVCLVRRTGTSPDGTNGIDQMETVDICALDNATTGIVLGTQQLGDRITFDSEGESDFYAYHGEHGEHGPSSGWLTFVRRTQAVVGGTFTR